MADAAQHKFDIVVLGRIDRSGRPVLHLSQQLATLTSYGILLYATAQTFGTDGENPNGWLLYHGFWIVDTPRAEKELQRAGKGLRRS